MLRNSFFVLISIFISLNPLYAAKQSMFVAAFQGFDEDGRPQKLCKEGEINIFGFPKGSEIYIGIVRPLLESSDLGVLKSNCLVSEQGFLVDATNGKFPGGFSFNKDDYIPGERLICVVDDKKGDRREFQFFPRPLAEISKDESWAISVEALKWSTFRIELIGVEKGEKLVLNAISGNECIRKEFEYDPNIDIVIEPAVVGKTGGIAIARIERAEGKYLEVKIPWGRALWKYFKE